MKADSTAPPVSALKSEDDAPHEALVQQVLDSLPSGQYEVLLLLTTPISVFPGTALDYFRHERLTDWEPYDLADAQDFPSSDYYLTESCTDLGDDGRLREFMIPLYSTEHTNRKRVDEWKTVILSQAAPAIAISVLDLKTPTIDPPPPHHLFLTHYLLDGHHRVLAAAELGHPVQILSFLSIEHSYLRPQYIDAVISSIPNLAGPQ